MNSLRVDSANVRRCVKPAALERTTFRHFLVLHYKATLGNGNGRYVSSRWFIFYLLIKHSVTIQKLRKIYEARLK